MKNKKAQLKMFENVGVLVVFFFLLGIGVVFYFNHQSQAFAIEQKKLLELRSLQLAEQMYNLPELDCHYGSVRIDGCIDKIKLNIFKTIIENKKEQYFDIFAYSTIKINQIYPVQEEIILYDEKISYDEKPLEKFVSRVYKIPVLLFDSTDQNAHCKGQLGRCSLAILDVTYYEER